MEPSKSIRTTWSIRVFMSPSTVCTVSGAPPRYRGIGQYACQVIDLQSQLESEPAPQGVRYRLAWGRMTTARIGPQAGPGAFGGSTTLSGVGPVHAADLCGRVTAMWLRIRRW